MKKIAIITGASSGMGKDFALQIAKNYKDVCNELWLISRRKENLENLAKEIEQIGSSPVPKVFALDICGKEGVQNLKQILDEQKEFCKNPNDFEIKLLVNNAGFGTYGPFEKTDTEKEMQMIDLNCTSLTGITSICFPYMKKNSFIINTSSLAAFAPLGNFAVYAATKAFVLSFSTALSAELKHRGIKVCALCPGSVSTEFANVASNGARKEVLHGTPSSPVVAHCLKKAFKGKRIAIYCFKWKFKAFMSKIIGAYAIASFTYKYCKRPYNEEK